MGGEQTDFFHVLNRRGGPVAERPLVAVHEDVVDWSPGNLIRGVAGPGAWVQNALHCPVFDSKAYRRVVTK